RDGQVRRARRPAPYRDVVGTRRVPVPRDQGSPAGRSAVHDPLPLVLLVASRRRVRLRVRRPGSRDAEVGARVQPLRPVLEGRRAAEARRPAAALRGPVQGFLPLAAPLVSAGLTGPRSAWSTTINTPRYPGRTSRCTLPRGGRRCESGRR